MNAAEKLAREAKRRRNLSQSAPERVAGVPLAYLADMMGRAMGRTKGEEEGS